MPTGLDLLAQGHVDASAGLYAHRIGHQPGLDMTRGQRFGRAGIGARGGGCNQGPACNQGKDDGHDAEILKTGTNGHGTPMAQAEPTGTRPRPLTYPLRV